MSALRISRPGIAGTTLIPLDDGAVPLARSHRFDLLGDVFMTPNRALAPKQPFRPPNYRQPYKGPRCGYLMPKSGVPCYRRPHDDRDHRSEETVRKDSERKATRKSRREERDASSGVQRS